MNYDQNYDHSNIYHLVTPGIYINSQLFWVGRETTDRKIRSQPQLKNNNYPDCSTAQKVNDSTDGSEEDVQYFIHIKDASVSK